jgi:hypothetical protein
MALVLVVEIPIFGSWVMGILDSEGFEELYKFD